MEIQDRALREKFNAIELEQVKKRSERVTIFLWIVTVLMVMFTAKEKRNAYLITVSDLNVIGIILCTIGRVWTPIHFATLPLIVIGRCCWAIFLLF